MTETALSPRWLRRARRLNPHYKARLHWSVPGGWPDDVAGREFAERVAAFQVEHGALTADGILGPKTWEELQGRTWEPPAREYLIVGGERIAVPFPRRHLARAWRAVVLRQARLGETTRPDR